MARKAVRLKSGEALTSQFDVRSIGELFLPRAIARRRLLDWHAGASVHLEIFNPGPGSGETYKLKYTLPVITRAIRPPVTDLFHWAQGETWSVDQLMTRVGRATLSNGWPSPGAAIPKG